MAFRDLPIIDPPSIHSERSELALLALLNQQSGFICRPDRPDKGCDFDVELVVNGRNAANHRFGIQLKSVERLPLLADGSTISYSFETSRLGYLLSRPVGEGLIILYDVAGDRLYYDYAVDIYNRLTNVRNSDDWQQQDTVNIHIPAGNVLYPSAVAAIHEHFRRRFEAASFLLASQGTRYGLIIAKSSVNDQYDLNNPDHVRELLLHNGMSLLHAHEFDVCFWLLQKLPLKVIETNDDLLTLAALVYGQMGRRYDSESFIRKLYKRGGIPEDQKQMIRFCHLKNRMLLGQMEIADFKEAVVALRNEETNTKNILLLDLNIIYYELVLVRIYQDLPEDILARIRSIFERAAQLEIDERSRHLIAVNNAENLAEYIHLIRKTVFRDIAIRRAAGYAGRSPQIEDQRLQLQAAEAELHQVLQRIYSDARSRKDHLLQAHALLVQSRSHMAREIELYAQWPMLDHLRFHDERTYLENSRLALSGYDHFMAVGYVELAQLSLQTCIELILFGRNVYRYKDEMDLDRLFNQKDLLEREHELEPTALNFTALVEFRKLPYREGQAYMSHTGVMDDRELNGLAASISRAFGLPDNCKPNLLSELQNCRLFYQRGHEDLDLIPYDRRYTKQELYRTPVRFIIHNKKINLRSVPSSDVAALLDSWGL